MKVFENINDFYFKTSSLAAQLDISLFSEKTAVMEDFYRINFYHSYRSPLLTMLLLTESNPQSAKNFDDDYG